MKKLTLAISALAAAFGATAAKAEVSVSGSGSAAYIAPAGSGDSTISVGQFVSFGLSTTTSTGMTISGGMGLSNTPTVNNGQAVSGGKTLTFATGGATIVVGDVEASDTAGSVGGLVGDEVDDLGGLNTNVGSGFADDDGLGVSFTTALGSSTLKFVYVANDDADDMGGINVAGANALMSAGLTVPMGAYSVSVGVADSDTGESSSGASVSAALGGGTLTVGYSQQTLKTAEKSTAASYALNTASASTALVTTAATNGDLDVDGDTTVLGATYAMSLDADTSLAVGFQNAKDADNDSTSQFDATVSRALGGGASVFLELRNLSGDASQDGSAIAVGTRVSF
ncbi:MAG: porin [Proteobacteria bacterium]|nr:porin [Pseudomonadota bacterium]